MFPTDYEFLMLQDSMISRFLFYVIHHHKTRDYLRKLYVEFCDDISLDDPRHLWTWPMPWQLDALTRLLSKALRD